MVTPAPQVPHRASPSLRRRPASARGPRRRAASSAASRAASAPLDLTGLADSTPRPPATPAAPRPQASVQVDPVGAAVERVGARGRAPRTACRRSGRPHEGRRDQHVDPAATSVPGAPRGRPGAAAAVGALEVRTPAHRATGALTLHSAVELGRTGAPRSTSRRRRPGADLAAAASVERRPRQQPAARRGTTRSGPTRSRWSWKVDRAQDQVGGRRRPGGATSASSGDGPGGGLQPRRLGLRPHAAGGSQRGHHAGPGPAAARRGRPRAGRRRAPGRTRGPVDGKTASAWWGSRG